MAETSILDTRAVEQARRDYETDGAAVLRKAVSPYWIGRLAEGLERLIHESPTVGEMSRPGEGRFFQDMYSYLWNPEYREFIYESGIAEVAAELMRSQEVRFFYDQTFVKEPGTPKRTPWHHDTAYWPFSGQQVLSIWVPLDAATPTTGVLTYVKGSHRWKAFYPVEDWAEGQGPYGSVKSLSDEDPGPGASARQPRTILDIREHPENYEFCTWEVEPGDVLIHHKDAIHGAQGNLSQTQRRRAIAFRFLGDDARWDENRAQIFQTLRDVPGFDYPDLQTGDRINVSSFPLLWSKA